MRRKVVKVEGQMGLFDPRAVSRVPVEAPVPQREERAVPYAAQLEALVQATEAACKEAIGNGLRLAPGDYGIERRGTRWTSARSSVCPLGALVLSKHPNLGLSDGKTLGAALARLYGLPDDVPGALAFGFDGRAPGWMGHDAAWRAGADLRKRWALNL